MLNYETIEPKGTAEACVVLLHGLGATGHDLMDLVPYLQLPQNHRIRFIFPHAPSRPITLNNGYVMPGWYDITGLTEASREDLVGLNQSREMIEKIIQQQIAQGIPAQKIMLGGFSQGGALTLFTGLQQAEPLAGLIVLSAYFPCANNVEANLSLASKQMPIFIAHGTQDPVVPYAWGLRTEQKLKALGFSTEWQSYPIEHSICLPEIQAIAAFMHKCLS
ncbi:MAG: carboxylesterase [Gammaproteobacteria bacterium]|jgi:phospholipase/carboxylesterase|nr:carboxylesterase [Gammaproteobacteria bacterium]